MILCEHISQDHLIDLLIFDYKYMTLIVHDLRIFIFREYGLCRSFGVPCEKPDVTKLSVLYEGMEPQDARDILGTVQKVFREMQGAVQNEITPQQEQRRAYNQPTR